MARITGYDVLTEVADVAGTPDTTLIGNVDGYPKGTRASDNVDLWAIAGGGKNFKATKMQLIFSHSHATDADGTTSVYELMGSADNGPRQLICTLALTGGAANVVTGVDEVTWVDTAVATDKRTTGVVIDDSAGDRPVRVTVDLQGLRYWEGLFTGAGSTAVTAIAYYRLYTEGE